LVAILTTDSYYLAALPWHNIPARLTRDADKFLGRLALLMNDNDEDSQTCDHYKDDNIPYVHSFPE